MRSIHEIPLLLLVVVAALAAFGFWAMGHPNLRRPSCWATCSWWVSGRSSSQQPQPGRPRHPSCCCRIFSSVRVSAEYATYATGLIVTIDTLILDRLRTGMNMQSDLMSTVNGLKLYYRKPHVLGDGEIVE